MRNTIRGSESELHLFLFGGSGEEELRTFQNRVDNPLHFIQDEYIIVINQIQSQLYIHHFNLLIYFPLPNLLILRLIKNNNLSFILSPLLMLMSPNIRPSY